MNRRAPISRRGGCVLLTGAVLFGLTSLAVAGQVRCQTYEEQTLHRLHTICSDGTRGISMYHQTLQRWDTMITPPPGKTCTGQMNPRTQQVEVRCR